MTPSSVPETSAGLLMNSGSSPYRSVSRGRVGLVTQVYVEREIVPQSWVLRAGSAQAVPDAAEVCVDITLRGMARSSPYWPVISHQTVRRLLPGFAVSSLGDGMAVVAALLGEAGGLHAARSAAAATRPSGWQCGALHHRRGRHDRRPDPGRTADRLGRGGDRRRSGRGHLRGAVSVPSGAIEPWLACSH